MPEIIMPKVGDAMTEGKVVRWYKQAGDKVSKGEPVLEIETDKVNLDLEAEADGTLGDVSAKEGQMVPVGETLAQILAPGEKPSESRRATDKKDSIKHTTGEYQEAIEQKGPRRDKSQAVPPQNVIAIPVSGGQRRRSSPLARRMALDLGVPLESLQGSGPQGRIIAKDVEGAQNVGRASARPAPGIGRAEARPTLESKSIPLSAMRRTIAKRLAK
jgi:pyruvate dehydrogenase E2 component (dihydrolipoamide acetyltransferase)